MHNEALKMAKHAMTDACAKGYDCMTSQDWDDLKDCVETAKNAIKCDYYYRLVECMKKDEEEEKRQDKFFLEMLKDEHRDEYKRMREEYGEDEADRRFYDSYRHANGRFARKGTGMYMPRSSGRRRGYEEPMYHMMPDMYRDHTPEELRDMDRDSRNVMYYTPMGGGSMGGGGNISGGSNTGGNARSYTEGYNDGNRRGYEDGLAEGRRSGGDSRFERAKRGYEETKKSHNGNTPEDKKMNMTEFEKVLNIALDEIEDMLEDAPPEMKNMAKAKGMARLQKIS